MAKNLLLTSLSDGDRALLEPHLKPITFIQQTVLFAAGDTITQVYFPVSGVISLVVGLSTGEVVEAAMVGRDGVVGAAPALDGKIAVSSAIVQLAGEGLTCEPNALKAAAFKSQPLMSILIRHEQTLYSQAQQSAACMATHNVEARLCRWLLRARDLSGSDSLEFTQEFLAEMLGVRRTSVSTVAHVLQNAGILKYSRGRIQIVNLEALQDTACECFETVKSQYNALLSSKIDKA